MPWLLGAACAFVLFRALWAALLGDSTPELGSFVLPALFALVWSVFGTLALLAATVGFVRIAQRPGAASRFVADWLAPSGRRFMWVTGACAAALALACHVFVLDGAWLRGDESAYHFAARMLLQGRLSVASHPAKEFFDNAFMINDGRFYPKYLLGWPLLLAPGAALDLPQLMNPLYHGLTVPAIYMILRQEVGAAWARAGAVLFASAPMLLIGAATMLPHTSCLLALAWAWWLMIRASRENARLQDHLAFAAMLALAGFIRPTSTIGIGGPLAVAWLYRLRTGPARRSHRQALASLVAVGCLALALVVAVNHARTGGPFELAHARLAEYEESVQRVSLPAGDRHVDLSAPVRMLGTTASGFVRLNFDLLGWPIGLLAAWLALGDRRARLAWWAAIGFAVVHLPAADMGIDWAGPVHRYEIALPALVLCTIGLARMHRVITARGGAGALPLVPSLLAAAILCAWLGYVPVRAMALADLAGDIMAPIRAAERAGLNDAVVFAPRPWGRPCTTRTRHLVYARPNNDPELRNPVLWADHLSVERDRELMRYFPERKGYVLARKKNACEPLLLPLDRIDDDLAKVLDQPPRLER